MVAYTIFKAHVTYFSLKIAFNFQVKVSYIPCYTYLRAGTG